MNPSRKLKLAISFMGIKVVVVFALLAIGVCIMSNQDTIQREYLLFLMYSLFALAFFFVGLFFWLYQYALDLFKMKDVEHKEVESKLVLYSGRLNSITEYPEHVGIYSLDQNFRYTGFNEMHRLEMMRMWGGEVAEGKNILDLIPGKYGAAALRIYQRALSGEYFKVTTFFNNQYFTHVFSPVLDERGNVIGLSSSVLDVTDHIRAEQELENYKDQLEDLVQERTEQLQKQAAFFQEVLDGLPNLIFVRDMNHRYVLANKAMAHSFGLPGEEIIGKSITETHYNLKDAKKYEKQDEVVIREDTIFEEEALHHFPPNDKRWLFLSKRRLEIDGDVYVLGVHFDITNLKETELKLIQTNEDLKDTLKRLKSAQIRLIESEKMASLGQLTAGLAHEINNPINYVSGNVRPIRRDIAELKEYLDALKEGADREVIGFNYQGLFDELESLLDGVDEGTARVKNLMSDLNAFSLPDTSKKNMHDINESINTTLNLVKHQVKDRIKTIVKLEELPRTLCNSQQLSQVFLNIINNAIHSIQGEGTISIKSRLKGDFLVVKIVDSGEGISETDLSRIFDPFFTTKDVGEGTGLGLAISYRIIEEHGGEIYVKSKKGKGSSFKIVLPVLQSVS